MTNLEYFEALTLLVQNLEPSEIQALCGARKPELLDFLRTRARVYEKSLADAREKYAEPAELLRLDILKLLDSRFMTVADIAATLQSGGMEGINRALISKTVGELWRAGEILKRPVRINGHNAYAYRRRPTVKNMEKP
mgnify:CR=1 FL=1